MLVAQTARLIIRHFETRDAEFIVKLLNQPSFIENIGNKRVNNKQDAIKYLQSGPIDSYRNLGFGLNMLEHFDSNIPIGMCGLIKREELDDIDIGYALLPEYCGKGYANESAQAVLDNGKKEFALKRIIAITKISNFYSIKLLQGLGFEFEKSIHLYEDDNKLFAMNFDNIQTGTT